MSLEKFAAEMRQSLAAQTFRRLLLTRPVPGEERRSLQCRLVEIRGEVLLQLLERFPRQDRTENLTFEQALPRLERECGQHFLDAHLETADVHLSLRYSRKGVPHLSRQKSTAESAPPLLANDRSKPRLISSELPWLDDLGLAQQGKILPSMAHKWRQMQRFVELLDHAWRDVDWPSGEPLRAADLGSGKGYLTFAVHDWLTHSRQLAADVLGIEQRPELVGFCNSVAERRALAGLSFRCASIDAQKSLPVDLLVALHACDTATDDALALGIRSEARMIVCAPCCQHQIRSVLQPTETIAGLTSHGLLRQRTAELLTDALRALLLEREGYTVRAVEFVSAEHTDKNLLLIATRRRAPSANIAEIQRQIDSLKSLFGIAAHHLEDALRC